MTVTSKISSIKNCNVFLTTFLPDTGTPRAIIQVNHGMAEHSERYYEFAQFLCDNGFGVYLHDHPGHGKTAGDLDKAGHLNWNNGWSNLLDVIHNINKTIRKAHPNVPVFLFGHSMGSLLARYYNATYPMYFKGMILTGTINPNATALKTIMGLIRFMNTYRHQTHKSKWLNEFFYRNFNKGIKNPSTRFDWLSSNSMEVTKYINDPFCGFHLSLGFLKNLFRGSLMVLQVEKNLKFRKNFATLLLSGQEDPSGNYGKDPKDVKVKYVEQGYFNTHLFLIEGRHELFNEVEVIKNKAFSIVLTWLDEKLKGSF
jgi:alpha-beta hydrolase superfamily lysophospholipase